MKIHQLFLLAAGITAAIYGQSQPSPKLELPGSGDKPAASPSAASVSPDTVVLSVGGEKFTRAQFEQILAAVAESGANTTAPGAKKAMAGELGQLVALAQEARRRKLDQTNSSKQMMMIQADTVLSRELQRQVASEIVVDDATMHSFYDAHKAQYEQAKARHILIRFKGSAVPARAGEKDLTEAEALAKAQEIEKKLAAGGDFAALAKAESDDTGTGASGGELPPFGRGQMVPEFEKVVFSQTVGRVSEPVKSKYGYHIILVEERTTKTFEDAKADIARQLKPQLVREAIEQLQKQVGVVMNEDYFGK